MTTSFAAQRLALSFTSWFRVPEHMQQRELLSRASAFVVSARNRRRHSMHIVTALHVPCPFYFPKYYPRAQYPWLSAVEPEHVTCTLEIRKPSSGAVLAQFELGRRIFASENRDLCVLHLRDEKAFADAADRHWVSALNLQPTPDFSRDRDLEFVGHLVPDHAVPDADEAIQFPHREQGRFNVQAGTQFFATTRAALSMGMCGGPVMRAGQCIGMLEGIVPPHDKPDQLSDLHRRVLNNACFVPADDIISLLTAVEGSLQSEADADADEGASNDADDAGGSAVFTPVPIELPEHLAKPLPVREDADGDRR